MTKSHNSQKIKVIIVLLISWLTLDADELQIVKAGSNEPNKTVQITLLNGMFYISVSELTNALDSYVRTELQTANFNLLFHKIDIYAQSPFVQIDNNLYQLPSEVYSRFDGYFLPYPYFCSLIASLDSRIEFNSKAGQFTLNMHKPNILQMDMVRSEESIQLSLQTSFNVNKNNIVLEKKDGAVECVIKNGIFSPNINIHHIEHPFEQLNISHPEFDVSRLYIVLGENLEFDSLKIHNKRQINLIFHNRYTEKSVFAELRKEREKWRIDTIIIDPGHGGRDPGAVGPGGLYERNITLSIAKSICDLLENEDNIKVQLTRDSNSFVALKRRTEIANQTGGKLFISIHVDANPVHSLRGHTVYFMGPAKTKAARQAAQFENSVIKFESKQAHYDKLSDAAFILAANAQNSYNKESQDLADIIDRKMTDICGSRSIGVRQAGFYVLYGASMPNILIETGFMTNPYDRANLRTKAYQTKLAQAICKGILEFKTKYENLNL